MASPHGISLQVTIHITPENVEKFFALIKPVYDLVIAERECRFFEIYQSQEDPGAVSWVEHWYISVFLNVVVCQVSNTLEKGWDGPMAF